MTTLSYAVADSATMLRRHLRRMVRYPTMFLYVVGMPIVFMLLFVYVFGGALGAGLSPGVSGGRSEYADYLAPGILVFTVAGGGLGAAIGIAMDMNEGIIARFRTMAISRASVLTGHVLGTFLQTMLGITVVIGAALLVGFRPDANPLEWVAAIGLLGLMALALTWFCAACGLVAKSVESASNLPMPLMLLPFLGSGFAPTESMPEPVRWIADHQPFTPLTEAVRGLLLGSAIGSDAIVAVAWATAIAVLSYLWAKGLYNRDPSRQS